MTFGVYMQNLDTINEADMEVIMACEPDIIFMDGRMADSYDALSEIAPVVRLATDVELGLVGSVRKKTKTIASIFRLENGLVMGTDAYQNGNIVYLASHGVWYTAQGGITALDTMISDLQSALLQK